MALKDGPFDAIDSEEFWKIIFQKSAQMGYTSSIMGGALARWMDNDPSAIVVVFPTTDSAREYVAEKFRPNRASPEVFALALGGTVEDIPEDSGSVVDGEFIPAKKGEIVKLPHDHIAPSYFELKDINGIFVAGDDFNINTDTGVVEIVSDKLEKATGVTVSYSYDIPAKVRMQLGTETQFSMRIEFDGINVSGGGKRVKGEIYRAMVTPSEAVNLHSNEPVVATLTGKLSTPAGKKAPLVLEMEA